MRLLASLAALTALSSANVEARLFWQTYGAVVPSGGACTWNLNQDYFVPRHCSAGAYALFGPCKKDDGSSPACRNLHPIYSGYCTPYGACRYNWRDYIHKCYCGCTPLRYEYGPWHLHTARTCFALKDQGACFPATRGWGTGTPSQNADPLVDQGLALPNVEMLGGETLGSIPALPAAMGGGMAGATAGGRVAVPAGTSSGPSSMGQPSVGGVAFPGLGR